MHLTKEMQFIDYSLNIYGNVKHIYTLSIIIQKYYK